MKKMNVIKLFVGACVATLVTFAACKKDETTAPQTTNDAGTGGQCIAGNTGTGGNAGGALPTGGSTATGGMGGSELVAGGGGN